MEPPPSDRDGPTPSGNRERLRAPLPGGRVLVIREGDLATEEADALVNAANEFLSHGGGVAGALSRAAGPTLQEESDALVREAGPVPVGSVAVTGAGDLPCRAVVHAVGPMWGEGNEDALLASAVAASLDACEERGFGSAALPALSTGIFGFPMDRAARVTLDAVEEWCRDHPPGPLLEIRLVLYGPSSVDAFLAAHRAP